MKNRVKNLWPVGWLILIWFLSFLPMFFFRRLIQWDLMEFFLPVQIYESDVFRSGLAPLWNPFQDCGVPLFSNPQSGLWYPINQIIIWTVGSSLVHAVGAPVPLPVAGIMAYIFSRKLGLSRAGGCLSAASYMLSGLFIGNTEHITMLVSFAWLPLALAGVHGWLAHRQRHNLWILGIALLLMLTGGYPGTNLIAFLFVGLYALTKILELWPQEGAGRFLLAGLLPLGMVCLVAALLSGISLLPSFADLNGYTDRGGGLSYKKSVESNMLPVWSLLSLFIPAASFYTPLQFFGGDNSLSMINSYFGLIALVLALFAIYYKRDRRNLTFAALGLAALLVALGSRAVLRGFLYEMVPFFKIFRHPALFRGIFILFFALLAGVGLDELATKKTEELEPFLKTIRLLIFGLSISLVMAMLAALILMTRNQDVSLVKVVFLESLPLQIMLLMVFYFLLKSQKKYVAVGILFLASLDLSFMVQANMDTVGYYPDTIKRDFFESVRNRERGVKFKSMPSRIDTWKDDNQDREYGMVMKKFLTAGYDPFRSQDFAKVMDTGFHAVVGNFPSFFLVSAVSVSNSLDASLPVFSRANEEDTMPVIVSAPPPAGIGVQPDAEYSLDELSNNQIELGSYSVDRIEMSFTNEKPALSATTEGFHPGWQATLDGKAVPTVKVNFAFRGVYVPESGTHRLVWEFKPKSFYQGLWVSASGLVMLAGWVLIALVRRPSPKNAPRPQSSKPGHNQKRSSKSK